MGRPTECPRVTEDMDEEETSAGACADICDGMPGNELRAPDRLSVFRCTEARMAGYPGWSLVRGTRRAAAYTLALSSLLAGGKLRSLRNGSLPEEELLVSLVSSLRGTTAVPDRCRIAALGGAGAGAVCLSGSCVIVLTVWIEYVFSGSPNQQLKFRAVCRGGGSHGGSGTQAGQPSLLLSPGQPGGSSGADGKQLWRTALPCPQVIGSAEGWAVLGHQLRCPDPLPGLQLAWGRPIIRILPMARSWEAQRDKGARCSCQDAEAL